MIIVYLLFISCFDFLISIDSLCGINTQTSFWPSDIRSLGQWAEIVTTLSNFKAILNANCEARIMKTNIKVNEITHWFDKCSNRWTERSVRKGHKKTENTKHRGKSNYYRQSITFGSKTGWVRRQIIPYISFNSSQDSTVWNQVKS